MTRPATADGGRGRRDERRPPAPADRARRSRPPGAERPDRADPVRRRRLPGRRHEPRGSPSPRSTRARTCSRSGCRIRIPLADGATLQRASQVALAPARPSTARSSCPADRRRAPGDPARAHVLREPGHRRRRRRARRRGGSPMRARPGSSWPTSRPTRARRSRRSPREAGLAVVYLVAPDDAARAPRRDRGPVRRLPLLRVARRA